MTLIPYIQPSMLVPLRIKRASIYALPEDSKSLNLLIKPGPKIPRLC